MFRKILVQTEDFDVGAEIENASGIGRDVGAIASFVGLCRSEGGTLNGVDLEAYPEMAYRELDMIVSAASSRWALEGVTVIHRYGRILTGGRIVLVVVTARHRSDAFAAAEFIMDFLKQNAPFWKRELYVADDSKSAPWVEAKSADAMAASRWRAIENRPDGNERMKHFTHLDDSGAANMVDVSIKEPSLREAVAEGRITMSGNAAAAIREQSAVKGDVLAVARIAGIMAAKNTSMHIPLCHPLRLSGVTLDLQVEDNFVTVRGTVRAFDVTGVEMEALTAVSVALLSVYDMVKSIDRGMTMDGIRLISKLGGRSGVWQARHGQ